MGTSTDYPFLMVAAHVRADAVVGSSTTVTPNMTFTSPDGTPLAATDTPGTLTVGGSLFVHDIIPGGGTWPAGTVVRMLGAGFSRSTSIRTTFKWKTATLVSANEIDFVLDGATAMNAQMVVLNNPDKSAVKYFSYIRGSEAVKSALPVVAATTAIFPQLTFANVSTQVNSSGITGTVVTALALQNPNPAAVTVKLEADNPATGKIAETTLTLAFGQKITRELGEFFGSPLPSGTIVKAVSTLPVQSIAFTADTSTAAVWAYLPAGF
jgi:hypothetical protein